jgi:hypothetical protein
MGPKTYGLSLLATINSRCSTTPHVFPWSSPLVGTCPQNPCTFYVPFPSWPLPFLTSTAFLHQVVWPLTLLHLHHLGVVHVSTKLWAQLVTCPSPFGRGWNWLQNAPSCYNKTRPTPNGPFNLVDLLSHNSLGIVGWPSSPSQFFHRFGVGKRCSFWAPTPCVSIGLTKACSWTLGLDSTLCLLGGHDAWTREWKITFLSLGSWHYLSWERNVSSC